MFSMLFSISGSSSTGGYSVKSEMKIVLLLEFAAAAAAVACDVKMLVLLACLLAFFVYFLFTSHGHRCRRCLLLLLDAVVAVCVSITKEPFCSTPIILQ